MYAKTKVDGAWKSVYAPYLKVSGVWKIAKAAYIKINGVWKNWFLNGGVLDAPFGQNLPFPTTTDVVAIGLLSDGKILAGGSFTLPTMSYLTRLNSDGTRDTTWPAFNLSYLKNTAILELPNGIYLFGRSVRNCLYGLNPNGTINTSFGATDNRELRNADETSFNFPYVNCLRLTPSNKVLVGGKFDRYNGQSGTPVNNFIQYNLDGTLDTTFLSNIGTGLGTTVVFQNCIAVQPDGKIILVGNFSSFNGTTAPKIIRLNSDGTIDTSFLTTVGTGFSSVPNQVWVQNDGKIIVVCPNVYQTTVADFNGTSAGRVVRLNSDGSLDTSFSTIGFVWATNATNALPLPSGKVFLYGFPTATTTDVMRRGVALLNTDGSVNAAFKANVNLGVAWAGGSASLYDAKLQPDGKILVSGRISSYDGVQSNLIARIGSEIIE